jgi:ABC-type transport system involved in multi-copper enzyme maturation permease subunit
VKKLVLKELREHFKVTLIGLAVFTVMLVLAFLACGGSLQRSALASGYSDAEDFQPLLAKSLLTQAAFFCAVFATLLGWLQIRAEQHPDLWAFLVHRPISRATILRSKILGGLVLYAAGAGWPLLGLIIVAAMPGHVAAPFEWAMVLPLLAIFLVGAAYYFAGLLTGLRKARWYASRVFGLGPAVIATFALFIVPEFWQALLIIVVAGALLALAVWGSFKTGGYYRAQPALSKFALTVASMLSVLLLLTVVVTVVANLSLSSAGYTWSQYQVTRDGKVVTVTQRGLDEGEIANLDGKPVVNEKTGQKLKMKEAQQRFAVGLSATVDFGNRSGATARRHENYCSAFRFFQPWRVLDKTLWYLTADGHLHAYHGITRRFVGALKPPGSPGPPDDSGFMMPANYWQRSFQSYELAEVLASSRTAYLVDLEKRELKPLFTATNGDAIGGFAEQRSSFYPAASNLVLVLTRTSIRLLDFAGTPRLQLPFEPSPPAYSAVSVLLLEPANTFAVRLEPDYFVNRKAGGKLLGQCKFIGADGMVRTSIELPKLPEPSRELWAEKSALVLAPPAFPFYSWEEPYRVPNILRSIPAILCAIAGWWLGRRHNLTLRAQVAWGIFHFLFGLPGLLAFLAVQEWPAREPCPNCRKLRAVNREQCEYCAADFAPPAKTGIEIFEPLVSK